jgi:site-specific recombinase XerD
LKRITQADVQRWGDQRIAEGIQPKTVNDTYFAALRAVFKWGKQRGWLSSNPAQEAKIEGRGKKVTREKWFLEDERAAILNAALTVRGSKKERSRARCF